MAIFLLDDALVKARALEFKSKSLKIFNSNLVSSSIEYTQSLLKVFALIVFYFP